MRSGPDLLAKLTGRRKEEYGREWVKNIGGAIAGDGKGMEEKQKGDRHRPHVRSAGTFQPWLR